MGRKTAASSAKSKEKRLQRKEEKQRISQAMAAVADANKLEDPLEPFPVFRKFSKSGIEADIFVKRLSQLEDSVQQWAFNLTKRNMQLKYEQCSWGWSDEKKLEELTDERAWYLIAKCVDGTYLGFSHFRFDVDEGLEVLYCYELQLEPFIQRKGLGKFMMQVLELMAFKNNMKKVVLTVLKNNQYSKFFKAMSVFLKEGITIRKCHKCAVGQKYMAMQNFMKIGRWEENYELDESSPIDDEDETYPYEILSKVNKRLAGTIPISSFAKNHMNGHCCSGHNHCH